MTKGMPIRTGIPFPQGIESGSARPRLEDAVAAPVGTETIDRLRRRRRGPGRYWRRCHGFLRRRGRRLLLPLREEEFCAGHALGVGSERVFRAWRRSHHRFQAAFLLAPRRSNRGRRRHQRHGGSRFRRHGLDHLALPMLLAFPLTFTTLAPAQQGSARETRHQQRAPAQRPKQRGIDPGLRRRNWRRPYRNGGCWRSGRLYRRRGRRFALHRGRSALRGRDRLGPRCRSGRWPWCAPLHRSRYRSLRLLLRLRRRNGGIQPLFDRRRRLNHRLRGRKCWSGRSRRLLRFRGWIDNHRLARRHDGLREQRRRTESQNSGNRGPGGAK